MSVRRCYIDVFGLIFDHAPPFPRTTADPTTPDVEVDAVKDAAMWSAVEDAIRAARQGTLPLPAAAELPSHRRLAEAEILSLAFDAGVRAGEQLPEGAACGRGDVMRAGELSFVHDPLLESPFGQDYARHQAFAEAAVRVLRSQGIAAVARVSLD